MHWKGQTFVQIWSLERMGNHFKMCIHDEDTIPCNNIYNLYWNRLQRDK